MKIFFTLTFTLLIFAQTVRAETIVETITQSKKWTAVKVDDHSAWGTSACLASTLGDSNNSVLEVYAEKIPSGDFAEPTVQVLFAVGAQEVFSADASTDNGKKWSFTRASTPKDPTMQALIARINDRNAIVDALKQQNTFTVKLKDAKGKVVSTLKFSLSGSSKTIGGQFSSCKISFDSL